MKTHSEAFLKKRKFYMVLPLLVFPFITMIFWSLGGGKGGEVQAQEMKSGLNLELPGAHFKKGEELWDKFSLYEQAKRDSLKHEEAKRNDPYYVMTTLKGIDFNDTVPNSNQMNTSLGTKDKYNQISQDEREINHKIKQLTQQLNKEEIQSSKVTSTNGSPVSEYQSLEQKPLSDDMERLEKMMQIVNEGEGTDPEMKQLDGMLEKILDIQHPDRVKDKLREQSKLHKQNVYSVQPSQNEDNISMVGSSTITAVDTIHHQALIVESAPQNSFFGLTDEPSVTDEESNAIEAVVHDTQTVVAGATVKLRLLSDIFINGELIPKDQFVFGICAISGDRLTISITSIREEHSLFPVALEVYDLDGMHGINIPGAISRDVAKQASAQGIQDIQMSSMSNSLEIQAASAGIEAAKGLFTKKVKLIKVTIKAGYQVLLKDKNLTT